MARKSSRRTRRKATTPRPRPQRRFASTAEDLLREAISMHRVGRCRAAERMYREVLRHAPNHPAALQYLALLVKESGRVDEAIELLRRSLQRSPHDPICHNNLGNMLREQGSLAEALEAYTKALELRPDYGTAHFNVGTILKRQGNYSEAEIHLRRAVELIPDDAEGWGAFGALLVLEDKFEEAQSALETSIRLDPSYAEAHYELGSLHMTQGHAGAAMEHYRKVTELKPDHAMTQMALASLRRFGAHDRDEISKVESMLDRAGDDEEARAYLSFALGKMHDDCGGHEKAFDHYETANRLRARTAEFDMDAHREQVARTVRTFTPAFFERFNRGACGSELPIFIVGMPRSGTTLVEQIIASHPRAHGAGELTFIGRLADKELPHRLGQPYPECVALIDDSLAQSLAAGYGEHLRSASPGALRVTDKAVTHFLHLGLLARLFPAARFIHCKRDLMDVAVSLYFQCFLPGLLEFSYDLKAIAEYCRLYERLMHHWRRVLPVEMHEVSYEALVSNQEAVSRSLIEHCGLPWDDRCLAYHETNRVVRNNSHWPSTPRAPRTGSPPAPRRPGARSRSF